MWTTHSIDEMFHFRKGQATIEWHLPNGEKWANTSLINNVSQNSIQPKENNSTLNQSKGNSAQSRHGQSEANIQTVRQKLAENLRGISRRRNGVGLQYATFNGVSIDYQWMTMSQQKLLLILETAR